MLYLSKGVVCKNSTTDNLRIAHGNTIITLRGTEAMVWLNGQFRMVSYPNTHDCEANIISLCREGIGEYECRNDEIGRYRILSRCICCPTKASILNARLSKPEKTVLEWITKAGVRLTTAELICLMENKIEPASALLSEENRQVLIETIYTKNNIFDNLLESQMEHAHCRDKVVTTLLSLLRKKRIVML